MKLTIHDRSKYIKSCDVQNLPIDYADTKDYQLFGQNVTFYDDPWMHHLHLKVTDKCNAKCSFCIEQDCCVDEDAEVYLRNLDITLNEMQKAGLLYSVSVTGGEPTLFSRFEDLCDILSKYDIGFLTLNTNGALLPKYRKKIDGLFDFVNISRHSILDHDNDIIFGTQVLTVSELKKLRKKFKKTKMRIQCVMWHGCMPKDMNDFVETYSFADDISFRRLMEVGDEYSLDYQIFEHDYRYCLEYAFNNWEFIEQTIQDYYVYEIYNCGTTNVTFSYSNMKMLRDVERTESESFYRELILHPNGILSGSWLKDRKILLNRGG